MALGTLAAALLHGPALAGLGVAGAFATPILVSSGKPDFWALYIYLAIVTAAAFGLARIRLWRWLAVTTIVFALLWTFPCLQCGPSMVGPHAFHVLAGFILAALLVVCGFMFGPPADEGQIEPISSGSLAAYLLGATLIVLNSFHADTAMIVFGLLVAGSLLVAWRSDAAAGAVGAAAAFVFLVFAEWAIRANPDMLVLPGGPLQGIGPSATDGSVSLHLISAAIFAAGFGVAGFLAQGRSAGPVIPVIWSAAAVFTPLALLVALYARIAHLDRSIPFAILAVVLAAAYAAATEILCQARRPSGTAGLDRAVCDRHARSTGAGADLCAGKGLADDRAGADVGRHRLDFDAAADSVPALAGRHPGRASWCCASADEPRIVGDAVGTTPIFNWLLWGYGIPAASFWAGSILLRRGGDDAPLRTVEAAAILFTVLLAFMEIRHAVNNGDVYRAERRPHRGCAAGLRRARDGDRAGAPAHPHRQRHSQCRRDPAHGFRRPRGGVRAVAAGKPDALVDRRRRRSHQPAAARLCPARRACAAVVLCGGRPAPVGYANTIAAGALILALAYVTFEIRRIYHGPVLVAGPTTGAEQYTYSIA